MSRGEGAAGTSSSLAPLASPAATGGGLLPLIAAGGAFLLYWRTMAPTVYGLDSAELTAGSYVLGIVHAPGSPTYLLLGHVFTWLPFGDVGYRVNLLSATAAAVAVGFLCAILRDLLDDRRQALVASWYVATTYYIWVTALAAEIYALHLAIVAGLIWLALRWRRRRRFALLYLFCLLFGVGLGGHLSLSVLIPGFAVVVADNRMHEWRPRVFAITALCGLLGASVYLYLPIRAAAGVGMDYARDFGVDVATWEGFWWMVSGQMFAPQVFGVPLEQLPIEAARYSYQLWSNFLGLGVLLGCVGLVVQLRRHPTVHLALLAMWIAHVAFVATYDVPDKDMMLATSFLLWGIWVAAGTQVVAAIVEKKTKGSVTLPASLLLGVMVVANIAVNYRRVDISEDWSARRRGELLLECLPRQSLYLASWADASILDYLQQVEGQRLDVSTVNTFLVRDWRRQRRITDHLARGLPVYGSQANLVWEQAWRSEYDAGCNFYRIVERSAAASSSSP